MRVKRLSRMLEELNPKVEIIAKLYSIQEAEQFFSNYTTLKTDVLFFDIQLGDGLSLELFDRFKILGILVFTTAYDQYAIQAFKVKAIDYLLKPIKIKDLEHVIQRIEEIIDNESKYENYFHQDTNKSKQLRFLVKMGKTLKVLNQEDIAYFYSNQKLSLIISWDGKKYPVDLSLNKIEEMAPADIFFRLNRRLLIHYESIQEMQVYSKSRLKIYLNPKLDEDIIVSTEKTSSFKKWLEGLK
jgi:two-component system, LytTR family, response regulator LytT